MTGVVLFAVDGQRDQRVDAAHPLPVTMSGGGGGGGAVTVADGADVTQGAVADAAYTSGSGTVVSLLKGLFTRAGIIFGANGTSVATALNPVPVFDAQGVIASGSATLVANTAQTIIAAFADRRGMRVLNYTASPVYLSLGTTGTPASGGGSDYIPAAVAGVPGQWEPPYAPVGGVRAVGASAGDLTVTVW